jgi:aminopeptidase N
LRLPIIFLFLSLILSSLAAQKKSEPYDVLNYDAELQINWQEHALSGTETIQLKSLSDNLSDIELDASNLFIDHVSEQGTEQLFDLTEKKLSIHLKRAAHTGEVRTLNLSYHANPKSGVYFYPDEVYTVFNTSSWLACHDKPEDKATFTLRLIVPAGMKVVANGRPVKQDQLKGDRTEHTWQQDAPLSTYIFGFAAGNFNELVQQRGPLQLRFLSKNYTREEMARIFEQTGAILDFYERRAGVVLPGERYTQVLVPGTIGQEMGGFTALPVDYGKEMLASPRKSWLMAHEFAHQWWGNSVTCRDWSDFWLNEGTATFMADAYLQQRFGQTEYDEEIESSRRAYARARARGRDRSIVFYNWTKPSETGGPITYDKGALVLHLLRYQLGERAFWDGLRRFTVEHMGGSVVTRDFQSAMEKASGQDLSDFFTHWVYRADLPIINARHRREKDQLIIELEQRQDAAAMWPIPLQVAVETTRGRESRRVMLTGKRTEIRFHINGPILSVRVDDGGHLPMRVSHERSVGMLLRQLAHEPDVAGRLDAIEQLTQVCANQKQKEKACESFKQALNERARNDSSTLVRETARKASP